MIRVLALTAFLALMFWGCATMQKDSERSDDDSWENTPIEDLMPEDDPVGPALRRRD